MAQSSEPVAQDDLNSLPYCKACGDEIGDRPGTKCLWHQHMKLASAGLATSSHRHNRQPSNLRLSSKLEPYERDAYQI